MLPLSNWLLPKITYKVNKVVLVQSCASLWINLEVMQLFAIGHSHRHTPFWPIGRSNFSLLGQKLWQPKRCFVDHLTDQPTKWRIELLVAFKTVPVAQSCTYKCTKLAWVSTQEKADMYIYIYSSYLNIWITFHICSWPILTKQSSSAVKSRTLVAEVKRKSPSNKMSHQKTFSSSRKHTSDMITCNYYWEAALQHMECPLNCKASSCWPQGNILRNMQMAVVSGRVRHMIFCICSSKWFPPGYANEWNQM